jgi:hypothetical protein
VQVYCGGGGRRGTSHLRAGTLGKGVASGDLDQKPLPGMELSRRSLGRNLAQPVACGD